MRMMRLFASAVLVGALSSVLAVPESFSEDSFETQVAVVQQAVREGSDLLPEVQPVKETKQVVGRADPAKRPEKMKVFLPDYMSKASPGSLLPLDKGVQEEKANQIAALFNKYYPDVTYHIEWDDDTVNAYAYKGDSGEPHVALLGGLLRHKSLQAEGISLVLAHELGHHYAGAPYYPGENMSCEGQADYWGAGTAMRKAYSSSYAQTLKPGIDQVITLFTYGLMSEKTPEQQSDLFKASAGCSHPPAECRKETYLAAMQGKPKPACAGGASQEDDSGWFAAAKKPAKDPTN